MRTGTLWCFLFGHCFVGKDQKYSGDILETQLIQMKFCRRCGIDKENK